MTNTGRKESIRRTLAQANRFVNDYSASMTKIAYDVAEHLEIHGTVCNCPKCRTQTQSAKDEFYSRLGWDIGFVEPKPKKTIPLKEDDGGFEDFIDLEGRI